MGKFPPDWKHNVVTLLSYEANEVGKNYTDNIDDENSENTDANSQCNFWENAIEDGNTLFKVNYDTW